MSAPELPQSFSSTKSATRSYEVVCKLAAGSTATVYLATRRDGEGERRLVVLKRERGDHGRSDPGGVLAQEARLASRVRHPNVVTILDGETVDDALVLVMEWVEGTTLQELAAGGALPPRIVARIVRDACAGLGAIHGATSGSDRKLGLVHRSVAPENVLVGVDGVSRLTDFGLAITSTSTRVTRKGIRKGKPAYMAPEYILHGVATPSTDLYALAAVAWQALTGQPMYPVEGSINEVATLQSRPFVAPTHATRLESMLLRALGRAGERFTDASSFARALDEACDGAVAEPAEVGALVERTAADALRGWRAAAKSL